MNLKACMKFITAALICGQLSSALIIKSFPCQLSIKAPQLSIPRRCSVPVSGYFTYGTKMFPALLASSSEPLNEIPSFPSENKTTTRKIPQWSFNLWSSYKKMLTSTPLLAKCFASVVGFGTGDIIAQLVLNKVYIFIEFLKKNLDIIIIPFSSVYIFLHRVVLLIFLD